MEYWKITFITDKIQTIYLRVHSDGLELNPRIQWASLTSHSQQWPMAGGQGCSQWQGEGWGHITFINLISNSMCLLRSHLCWWNERRAKRSVLLSLNSLTGGHRRGKKHCLLTRVLEFWWILPFMVFPFSWPWKTWNLRFFGSTFLLYELWGH